MCRSVCHEHAQNLIAPRVAAGWRGVGAGAQRNGTTKVRRRCAGTRRHTRLGDSSKHRSVRGATVVHSPCRPCAGSHLPCRSVRIHGLEDVILADWPHPAGIHRQVSVSVAYSARRACPPACGGRRASRPRPRSVVAPVAPARPWRAAGAFIPLRTPADVCSGDA